MDKINNAIQIFNEIVVLLCIQSMFLFTNYVPDVEVRYKMGQKVLYLLAANILLNMVVLISNLLSKIYTGLRNWYLKRRNRIFLERRTLHKSMKALN